MKRDVLERLIARPIAHRGLHDLARGRPENSLAAFAAAADAGYAIECDVHIASDGVPVVFHDDDLPRLTGADGGVRDLTAAALAGLGLAGTAEHVPTLTELLQLTAGRAPLVIELKHIKGRDSGLVRAVVEQLEGYDGEAGLMSFDHRLVAEIKSQAPDLVRGLTAAGDWRMGPLHLRTILALGVDFISYAIDDLPTPAPLFARRVLRLPLICWTVRTPAQLAKAHAWTDQITFEGFAP